MSAHQFAIDPPIQPMLVKVATDIPTGDAYLYEPKWDGFRAIVFRGGTGVYIQSRDLKPLDRYFPELHTACAAGLPDGCVIDGEILIATPRGLDFDALQMRLHPAASRVARLAQETPAAFVAFDVLAAGGDDVPRPATAGAAPPPGAAPGQGRTVDSCDPDGPRSRPGRRVAVAFRGGRPRRRDRQARVRHLPAWQARDDQGEAFRSADCVVAGFRWHKAGKGELVGSLLLGLYDDAGRLQHVGVTSAFTMAARRQLAAELEPMRKGALEQHPWREWAEGDGEATRMPGGQSRWSAGKDLSWEPVRIERVCEVKYDHMQGDRFRHAAIFQRWRADKQPAGCRYDQLEVTTP